MMPYSLTEDDLDFLERLGGALNAAQPNSATGRLDASINPAHPQRLNKLVADALKKPDPAPPGPGEPPADARVFPVKAQGGLLTSSAPATISYEPGVIEAYPIGEAGNASASVEEGGSGLYGVVLAAPLPASFAVANFAAWGAKAIEGLAAQPGQYLLLFSDSDKTLGGRADVRAA